jgi:exopolysaccharide production protein ExoQ
LTKLYSPRWQLATAHSSRSVSAPTAFCVRKTGTDADTPVSQQVLTWLLFWPVLTLIARQPVYFGGPARSAEVYQSGAAMAGPRGSHLPLVVHILFLLGFVLVGHLQVWSVLKKNLLIMTMLALAVCSALWSASATITLQMCVQMGLCTLFGCYLSARYRTERFMQFLIFMGVISALLSILFAVALPSYGIFQGYAGGAWEGISKHKNGLGVAMAFLLTPIFFTNHYGRWRRVLYAVLLLFIIYKSQSRGAWVDTAGMLLFIAWLGVVRRARSLELTIILLLTSVVGLATVVLGVHFWPLIAEQLGKTAGMSGRTAIYAETWRSIMKHPWFGYGFGAYWYPGNHESQRVGLALNWTNIGYAENGILEVALQLGFVGFGLIAAMIAQAAVQGARLVRSPHYSPRIGWFLTILVLATLTNLDAGWFMTSDTLDWVLILRSCIGMNEEIRRIRRLGEGDRDDGELALAS